MGGMTITGLAIIIGLVLIIFGAFCIRQTKPSQEKVLQHLLRNDSFGQGVFVIACLWFLAKVSTLTEADFGQYRSLLILIFLFSFSGCCIYWKDFLGVRGLSMLTLMGIQKGLEVGYMSEKYVHPYLSFFFYCCILLAIYFGIYPYCARDLLKKLFQKQGRYIRYIGGVCVGYGVVLMILAFR